MGADDPITQKCLEEIEEWEEGSQNQKKKLSQGQFGPHLITKIAKELDRFAEVYPMRYGHPTRGTGQKPSLYSSKPWDLSLLIGKNGRVILRALMERNPK